MGSGIWAQMPQWVTAPRAQCCVRGDHPRQREAPLGQSPSEFGQPPTALGGLPWAGCPWQSAASRRLSGLG